MNLEARPARTWPLLLLALPAFVAIWSGWVGLGERTGFGVVQPFPGIPGLDRVTLNTAITLPIGVETYAAYALRVWLAGVANDRARTFARWSAIGSLVLGGAGQIAYHLMVVGRFDPVTIGVSCLPVAVLGMGVGLAHLLNAGPDQQAPQSPSLVVEQLATGDGPQSLAGVVELIDHAGRAAAAIERQPAVTVAISSAPGGAPAEQPPAQAIPPAPGEPTRRAIRDLVSAEPELSQRQVAQRLGISPTTVGRAMQHAAPTAPGGA